MGSRRAHYRTVPNRWDQLRLEVVTSGGTLAAELLDISGSGLRLTLVEEYDRPAELGDTLTVRVHSDDLRQPLEIAALVVHSEHVDRRWEFGLQFLDWMGVVASVPKSMATMFNLRADPRLVMDPSIPVEVLIRGFESEFELRGVLCDVSRSGLSFSTQLLSKCVLNHIDHCIVEFTPPGQRRLYVFGSCIRYATLTGDSLRYGVWFDPTLTADFGLQQATLGAYVEERLETAVKTLFRAS
ncbi:MAG: PilZ domain-containing protein [Planctomycetes bacterium]|nr:PilZ domain-containing protein [Planctomycetota bacterium]